MLSLLAILFPLLCTAFLPDIYKEIERDFPEDTSRKPEPGTKDTTSSAYYMLGFLLLALPFGVVQWQLFQLAGRDDGYFTNRVSEMFVYSLIPGLFLALAVAGLPVYHFNRRRFGDNFAAHLEATVKGTSNRKNYRLFRPIAVGIGISFSILNFFAYDCYLSVDREALRYSSFFSIVGHRVPISEIVSGTVYERRRAPNGQINHRPYLTLNLRDGSVIDTFYLLEDNQFSGVLQAIEKARGEPLPVTRQRGP